MPEQRLNRSLNMPTTKDYVYVTIQFLLFLAYAWNPGWLPLELPWWVQNLGVAIAVTGLCTCVLALLQLNTTLSPFPTPVRHGQLTTKGVFALARHPIYTGIILVAFGYGLYSGSGYRLLVGLGLLVLFNFKAAYEEELLLQHYPDYGAYMKKVGRFTPFT